MTKSRRRLLTLQFARQAGDNFKVVHRLWLETEVIPDDPDAVRVVSKARLSKAVGLGAPVPQVSDEAARSVQMSIEDLLKVEEKEAT